MKWYKLLDLEEIRGREDGKGHILSNPRIHMGTGGIA